MATHVNDRVDAIRARPLDEEDLVVPVADRFAEGRIYDDTIPIFATLGAVVGGLVFGLFGYAVASGLLPLAGLGQFAAAGSDVGTFTAGGVGAAVGGLVGGLVAIYRIPRRHDDRETREHGRDEEHGAHSSESETDAEVEHAH